LGGDISSPLWKILAWSLGLIILFLFLAIRRYRGLTR
jgi:hypothetical protein